MGSTSEGSAYYASMLGSIGRGGSQAQTSAMFQVGRAKRANKQRQKDLSSNLPQMTDQGTRFSDEGKDLFKKFAQAKKPTSYSSGLYEDSSYGPILSSLALAENYRGDMFRFNDEQRRKNRGPGTYAGKDPLGNTMLGSGPGY